MKIVHDEKSSAFYVFENNLEIGELLYSIKEDNLIKLNSTWIEEDYRNQNLAITLTEAFIEFAKSKNLKIIPICSFSKVYFKRNYEKHHEILAPLK
ncbi:MULTISPECIES: GNAT family N-acetyltransferase [Cetobacterium]|jgi:predicted GNAT family acetyltransferase|uniref:GNAT family N-acetyltransferase n=1 Tax=Candidatus Cetobacterium colombiensis TaxID=3073100 RepID=A0ABU4W6N7_9FUSO|nr:GNAT family N-acetyltransferase [Candidatus Cetobacterium colombiensis]MDX8335187.1 GNAT family N-acetyltransferase [Candidatus Cetobacterium colombiensis]